MAASSSAPISPVLALPSAAELDQMVSDCHRLFQHHLAAWASDCLALRRRGADRAVWSAESEAEFAWLAEAA